MPTSLQVNGSFSVNGGATGTAGHPANVAPFFTSLSAALSSTGSGATLCNDGLYYADRSLSGNETFVLTNFSNALEESGRSLSKVRIYFVSHSSSSAATSITVGNAATPFPGVLDTSATTFTLTPGSCALFMVPTAAGIAVTAGMGIKVVANGGTATYSIGVFGET